jgi:hypothetical protein
MTSLKTHDQRAITLRAVADGEVRRVARPNGRCGVDGLFMLAEVDVGAVVRQFCHDGLVTELGAGPPTLTIAGWRALREGETARGTQLDEEH